MEVGVAGIFRVEFADSVVLEADLGVEQCGFQTYQTRKAPVDGGKLFDKRLLGVVSGLVGLAGFFNVEFECGLVFKFEGEVDDGGETVSKIVDTGAGFSFRCLGPFREGAVQAGLHSALFGNRDQFHVRVSFHEHTILQRTVVFGGISR